MDHTTIQTYDPKILKYVNDIELCHRDQDIHPVPAKIHFGTHYDAWAHPLPALVKMILHNKTQ